MYPKQLFAGVKVLAVARVIAAPFAAMHLALNGADVITIENPDEGDSARHSEVRDEFLKPMMSRGFLTLNVNKRSLTLALNTPEGQEIAAKNYYRPRLETVARKYAATFPKLTLVTIDEVFGGWQKAQKTHFADGGVFDDIQKQEPAK